MDPTIEHTPDLPSQRISAVLQATAAFFRDRPAHLGEADLLRVAGEASDIVRVLMIESGSNPAVAAQSAQALIEELTLADCLCERPTEMLRLLRD